MLQVQQDKYYALLVPVTVPVTLVVVSRNEAVPAMRA